ncbi:MAG TPA: ATP-dependent zinc metalloprotease FtsH [Anaerolineae bacterium]|nr:ATP-dependent zinc metalloprotease FtsH [Anaerolineae bacterium]
MESGKTTRWFIYAVILIAMVLLLWGYNNPPTPTTTVSISQVAADLRQGNIDTLEVDEDGREVLITYADSDQPTAITQVSDASSLEELLVAYGVDLQTLADTKIIYESPSPWAGWLSTIGIFLPTLLIIGIIFFFLRQAQGNNNQAMSFGKSRARMVSGDYPTVTFDDVAGANEAKQELAEVVEFLREPEKFIGFGARIPKGVMLVGAPGTGKTLLAKAVSGEAGVPFFAIAGSEFVEMFVGVGASRVRDLFEQAKTHSPCIIFIDEIDAVGRQRGAGLGGSHDEREQTLNQILVEMDGFGTDTHVIMLAATNRPDILDPALMRPGRFDRRVIIDKPDVGGREAILRVHMRGKPIARHVDVKTLAKATPGFVGADLENTVNEAALLAARRNRSDISMDEFQEAIERVQLGPERRSRVITPQEKELVAYHEAGHAIVSHLLPHSPVIRKVTIIPRGMAGGVTWYLEDENQMLTETKFRARIAGALGGRAAEAIVFGEVTTGASSDLRYVTNMARAMVTQYGMSDNLGLRVYGEKQEMVFLGREISEQRDYSDAIAELIDREVRDIIDLEYNRALDLLTDNRNKLELIAQKLLEIETLEAHEFAALMDGEDPFPPANSSTTPPSNPPPSSNNDKSSNWGAPKLDLPPSPSPA